MVFVKEIALDPQIPDPPWRAPTRSKPLYTRRTPTRRASVRRAPLLGGAI